MIPYRIFQKWTQTGAETYQSSTAARVESPKRVEALPLSLAAHDFRSSHTSAHRPTTLTQLPRDGTNLRVSSGLPINSRPSVICAFWSEEDAAIPFSTFLLCLVGLLQVPTVAFSQNIISRWENDSVAWNVVYQSAVPVTWLFTFSTCSGLSLSRLWLCWTCHTSC